MNEDKELYITCPACGKIQQKSRITDSEIKCSRCNERSYVYLKNGVIITTQYQECVFENRIRMLRSYAEKLIERISACKFE